MVKQFNFNLFHQGMGNQHRLIQNIFIMDRNALIKLNQSATHHITTQDIATQDITTQDITQTTQDITTTHNTSPPRAYQNACSTCRCTFFSYFNLEIWKLLVLYSSSRSSRPAYDLLCSWLLNDLTSARYDSKATDWTVLPRPISSARIPLIPWK